MIPKRLAASVGLTYSEDGPSTRTQKFTLEGGIDTSENDIVLDVQVILKTSPTRVEFDYCH